MPSIHVKPRPIDPAKPAAGVLQVRREHDGKPIAAKGETLELTPYIRRRLRDGDLVEVTPTRAKSTAKAASEE